MPFSLGGLLTNGGAGKPLGGKAPDGPQTLKQEVGRKMQSLRGVSCRAPSGGHFDTLVRLENGFSQSLPRFQGSLLKRTTDHPVEKLGNKFMSSLYRTVQASVDARISTDALLQPDSLESFFEGFGCKGWLDPGGRIQEEGPLEGRMPGEAVRHDSDRLFRNHVLAHREGGVQLNGGRERRVGNGNPGGASGR